MLPASKIMKTERNLSRWRGKTKKCSPESRGRLNDNVMLLIPTQLFEEASTKRGFKELGKEAWMLWARENPRLVGGHENGFED